MRGRRAAAVVCAAAAAVALAAAGCGGKKPAATTTAAPTTQQVRGATFSFTAPAGWRVAGTARGVAVSGPGAGLLTVSVYTLVKKYAPARFEAAAKELDKVAAQLATGRKGRLAAAGTVAVAGIPSRSYRIDYTLNGDALAQHVTFVLRDTTEWQLVCRRAAADADGDCARLLSTFTLAAR